MRRDTGRRLHTLGQGLVSLTLPGLEHASEVVDLVERVQHYLFDHADETVVYRLPGLFETLVRGHDPATQTFDRGVFGQSYTADLFVRDASGIALLDEFSSAAGGGLVAIGHSIADGGTASAVSAASAASALGL